MPDLSKKSKPMTTVEKLRRAERWRIKTGDLASTEIDGWNGNFLVPLDGDLWLVRISDGMGWRHASVSNAQKMILPTWHIMCRIKESFFGDESWAVEYHPAKDEYVNDCPWCLHLWEPLNEKMPIPPVILV